MIRFVVIGNGHAGKNHVNAISSLANAKLVAIVDEKMESKELDYQVFDSIESLLLSKVQFDVASIALPNYLHASVASILLESNHSVVIEKPITIHSSDNSALLLAINKSNRNVYPIMQNRFSNAVKSLKNIIEKNLLGDVFHVSVDAFWNRRNEFYLESNWKGKKEKDGGTLFTQFSHFIDLLFHLFGKIEPINAHFFNFTHENTVEFEDTGCFTFKNNNSLKSGVFNYSTAVFGKNLESTVRILGTKGDIKLGGQYFERIDFVEGSEELKEELNKMEVLDPKVAHQNNYKHFFEAVVDSEINGSAFPISTSEAFGVVEFIEKLYTKNPIQ